MAQDSATPIFSNEHDKKSLISSQQLSMSVTHNILTQYLLHTNLLINYSNESITKNVENRQEKLHTSSKPTLIYGIRVFVDSDNSIHLRQGIPELNIEYNDKGFTIKRVYKDLVCSGYNKLVWKVLERLDGNRTVSSILNEMADDDVSDANFFLCTLVRLGLTDNSGRYIGKLLHDFTKKGVIAGGEDDLYKLLDQSVDGKYKNYSEIKPIFIEKTVPANLIKLYELLCSRRSYRSYEDKSIKRYELECLLYASCGLTGRLTWKDKHLNLRSYPSSGGLYTVEIYPLLFSIEGMHQGLYHFSPDENALRLIDDKISAQSISNLCLPTEKPMINNVSAMICLVGQFPRHEFKYGQGGYRMMVAESGHISQNIILCATALGLQARPFGGLFDDLLNRRLGFQSESEAFLLSVIIGHAGKIK
jgi:SagB-type dehydrogenase family enzyme